MVHWWLRLSQEENGMKRFNLMVGMTVGTTLEWYDFFLFGACSVLVFDKTFFAANDPFIATLLSLSTFSVGFLARPLGGLIFGIAGDRFGRKRMLVISVLMMGLGTFAIGLLPTYVSIGFYAPLALMILRIVQGLAVGGEATGAISIIAESMPASDRALWTSFTMFAGPLANVLTSLVIFATQLIYGVDGFVAGAWRYTFFLSGVLVVLGFWIRRKVEESTMFVALARRSGGARRAPLMEALDNSSSEMIRGFFVKAAENTFLYIFSTFLLLLATRYLKFPRQEVLSALAWGSAFEVVVVLIAASVCDRVGRRPVLFAGFGLTVVASFSLFTLAPGASWQALQVTVLGCLACHGVILGAMAAYLAELFPTRTRYTALSTSYTLASVAGGSVAPLIGALLLQATDAAITVAFYATAVAIPALISVYLSRESRGIDFFSAEGLGTPDEAEAHDRAAAIAMTGGAHA
jgi:MFS family permease